ncbi:MAG: M48 family metalloprotease [Desulfatibacillaceae bacterium]
MPKSIARILAAALCVAMAFFSWNPSAYALTIKEERELGEKFIEKVREHYEMLDDPVIVEYVRRVGEKIVATMPPQPFTYRFYVIRDDTYNAFAGPGGHIAIHSGLIEAMESEDELAGILAHEAAHVSCRHISDKLSRDTKLQLASLAGVVASILLGGGGVGSALGMSSLAAGQTASLAYSRADETQADQIGLEYLHQAGYSASGLLRILSRIRQKQWYGPDQIPTYLTTHPAVAHRIAYLDSQIQGRGEQPASSFAFDKIRARIGALYGNRQTALARFEQALEKDPDDAAALYGKGLVLASAGSRKHAAKVLEQAVENRAFDPDLLRELGRVYHDLGRLDEARQTLEAAVQAAADMAESHFMLGRCLLDLGETGPAVRHLERGHELDPDNISGMYHLGNALGKTGRLGWAHYYLGLYHRARGDLKNAGFHLQKARSHAADKPDLRKRVEDEQKALPGHWGYDGRWQSGRQDAR